MTTLDTSLLDMTLDDIEDLPEFTTFPAGAYRISVTMAVDEINRKQCVRAEFKLLETLELSEAATDTPPAPNSVSSVLFMLDNQFGLGNLKKFCKPFVDRLGGSSIKDVVEQVKDIECLAILGVRKDKNDKEKMYQNVKEIQVV